MADDRDNPGGRVPPPLTYLLTLLLGLVLEGFTSPSCLTGGARPRIRTAFLAK